MAELRRGLDMLATGKVKPVIDKTFALQDVAQAHAYVESRAVRGKVVLIP